MGAKRVERKKRQKEIEKERIKIGGWFKILRGKCILRVWAQRMKGYQGI